MTLKIGMLVKVGPAYRMAEHPPYAGRGTHHADAWTGRVMRVVVLRAASAYSGASAGLGMAGVEDPEEEVDISVQRLTPVEKT